jgi:hypothetical protein
VKGEVVRDLRPPVGTPGRSAHGVELDLERADVTLGPLGRLARAELLERHPNGKHGQELLVVHRPHARPAERLGLDEPQELEVAKRLADGRLARPELAREPRLDQSLARLEVPAEYALQQEVPDLLAEDGA